jgi:hypothetical protein
MIINPLKAEARLSNVAYKVEFVGLYICLFAYSSRTDKPICTKLGMLIP